MCFSRAKPYFSSNSGHQSAEKVEQQVHAPRKPVEDAIVCDIYTVASLCRSILDEAIQSALSAGDESHDALMHEDLSKYFCGLKSC